DRFDFHDLVRSYARDRAVVTEPASQTTPAVARLLRFYRHGAALSMDIVNPGESDLRPRPEPADAAGAAICDLAAAVSWSDQESANLVAVARAAAHQLPSVTTDMSKILARYLDETGRFDQAFLLHSDALQAARATGDQEGQARALHNLGAVSARQIRPRAAIR